MYAYFLPTNSTKLTEKHLFDRLRLRLRTNRISGEFYEYQSRAELAQFVAKNTSIGTKNFISIGYDDDFHDLLNASSDLTNMAFGFIPTHKGGLVAQCLGISNPRQAYSILTHRKIRSMPLLQINQAVVLTQTNFKVDKNTEVTITIDQSLEIKASVSQVEIINNSLEEHTTKPIVLNLYHHLDTTTDHQKPIIKLNPSIRQPRQINQQIAHLQAERVEIESSEPLKNQLLDSPVTHLSVQLASQSATVMNKKHHDLSSDS